MVPAAKKQSIIIMTGAVAFLGVAAAAATAAALSPITLKPVTGRPHRFVDDSGREVLLHGTNAVTKGAVGSTRVLLMSG